VTRRDVRTSCGRASQGTIEITRHEDGRSAARSRPANGGTSALSQYARRAFPGCAFAYCLPPIGRRRYVPTAEAPSHSGRSLGQTNL